jgi:hypothetical protein
MDWSGRSGFGHGDGSLVRVQDVERDDEDT